MTHEFFASADDSIEEELHAEGIRHSLALKWQDADGTTQRRLSIECAGFFVGTDETEVKTLGEISDRLIAVDATRSRMTIRSMSCSRSRTWCVLMMTVCSSLR